MLGQVQYKQDKIGEPRNGRKEEAEPDGLVVPILGSRRPNQEEAPTRCSREGQFSSARERAEGAVSAHTPFHFLDCPTRAL